MGCWTRTDGALAQRAGVAVPAPVVEDGGGLALGDARIPWGMGLVPGSGHLWVDTGVLPLALAWRYGPGEYPRGAAGGAGVFP